MCVSVLALILILMKDLWNWWTRICQFPITAAQFTVDEYWELGIVIRNWNLGLGLVVLGSSQVSQVSGLG